jgi:predicted NBD/HSP70 family sugar kinase
MKVLMIDIGGTKVKLMVTGSEEVIKINSGPELGPPKLVAEVEPRIQQMQFDAISIGYPGLVIGGQIAREPANLGRGWIGFDFETALDRPVRIMNDAALQALGGYQGGRMLIFGIGTGIGSALIVDDAIVPLELGSLRMTAGSNVAEETSGAAIEKYGPEVWRGKVVTAIRMLQNVFWPTDTVIGGGKAKLLNPFPDGCRCGQNRDALRGAERLWGGHDMIADARQTSWHIRRSVSKDMML